MLQQLFGLEGKVALVTGGATGIGRAIAQGFLAAGAERVYLASRNLEALAAVAPEIGADGRCIAIRADLSTVDGCRNLAQILSKSESKLHILVNNAGGAWSSTFDDFPENGWDRVFQLNLKAPFFLIQALAPILANAGSDEDPARVINIGSIAGEIANGHGTFPYGLSKSALHHATRMLALELAPRRITVNAIAPGRFPTKLTGYVVADPERYRRECELIPLNRWGTNEDLAGLAILLASAAGSYISGDTIPVDGGAALVHPLDIS